MLKWMLAAGAAALAITSPALAERGGQGGGGKGQSAQKAERGGGQKTQTAKANRSGSKDRGGGDQTARGGDELARGKDRGRGGSDRAQFAQRGEAKQKGGGQDGFRAGNRGSDRVRVAKGDRSDQIKGNRSGYDGNVKAVRVDRDRDVRIARINRDFDGVRFVPRWNERGLSRGFVDGCPPGLAKKDNGCLPPGQAKKIFGTPLNATIRANTLGWPYRQWYRDDDRYIYRWDDDYIYRVRRDGDLIDAFFPYANRDYYYYPMGASYPDYYNYYNVPYQYQSFYPDNGDYWYRYGDGAIYQVNPGTGVIQGIVALLTGTPMGIGQPLPPAYGVYNVPFAYRDQYYDTPNDWYRYNDGYIYRVDPTTQLITAVIDAIV